MSVISKISCDAATITKPLGPLDAIHYTCYEVGHTWNSSCTLTYLDTFHKAFVYSLKLYGPLYTLGALWKLKNGKSKKEKLLKNALFSTLRSSFFLAMNGTYFIVVFCCYGMIVGKYHGISGLIVGAVASFLSIILERRSRRGLLAIYSLNLALESLFKMAVSRGYVSPVRKGEVFLFAITNLAYMSMYRSSNLPPFIQSAFEKAFGREEVKSIKVTNEKPSRRNIDLFNTSFARMYKRIELLYKKVVKIIDSIGPNTPVCHHSHSCSTYAIKGVIKYFTIGYLIQVLLKYRTIVIALVNKNLELIGTSFNDFALAKFLCAYVALFRFMNCTLRWISGRDHPEIFGGISGLISGLSASYYPSTGISMYAFTKLLDILCMKAVNANYLPRFPNFDTFVYSMSLGVLFHAAVFEPHNIRPSYWGFLKALSGYKFPQMFRKLLDKFGTEASKMYPDFVPNLNPKFVKSEEVKRILLEAGKW